MQSVWSITHLHQGGSPLPVEAAAPSEQSERTFGWKKTQEEWTALRKFLE